MEEPVDRVARLASLAEAATVVMAVRRALAATVGWMATVVTVATAGLQASPEMVGTQTAAPFTTPGPSLSLMRHFPRTQSRVVRVDPAVTEVSQETQRTTLMVEMLAKGDTAVSLARSRVIPVPAPMAPMAGTGVSEVVAPLKMTELPLLQAISRATLRLGETVAMAGRVEGPASPNRATLTVSSQ